MHGAVPAFHGDPQLSIGLGFYRHRQAGEHAVATAEEDHTRSPQAARFADAQVGGLDLIDAALAQGGGEVLDVLAAFGGGAFDAALGQGQAPGTDRDVAHGAFAQTTVTAIPGVLGEIVRHEAQRDEHQ